MKYIKRTEEITLAKHLEFSGGVMVVGPKACGKTSLCRQFANSEVNLQTDERLKFAKQTTPAVFLKGETPHLIDEWQMLPSLFNSIRHEIDLRQKPGQFIITGSSTPKDTSTLHSGAGRITRIRMQTMSWFERGWSNGVVSLEKLLSREPYTIEDGHQGLGIEEIFTRLCCGGWPTNIRLSENKAIEVNQNYIDLMVESDMKELGNSSHNPAKIKAMLQSYARNIATAAKFQSITEDVLASGSAHITRETVSHYHSEVERMMVIDDLPAWNVATRSSARLRTTPKRHFCDASLAVASLGLNSERLIDELNYSGFVFESTAIHDLRSYSSLIDAHVYFYLDSDRDEVDAIVEKRDGTWAAFEIKLGAGAVETAAKSLLRFTKKIHPAKLDKMASLNVITGTGYSYTRRDDGINVIPLNCLGA